MIGKSQYIGKLVIEYISAHKASILGARTCEEPLALPCSLGRQSCAQSCYIKRTRPLHWRGVLVIGPNLLLVWGDAGPELERGVPLRMSDESRLSPRFLLTIHYTQNPAHSTKHVVA